MPSRLLFDANGSNQERIASVPAVIAKHVRSLTDVSDDNIEVAIVVEIARGKRPAWLFQREPRTRSRSNIFEFSGSVVLQQQIALLVTGAVAKHAYIVDHVAISDGQIEVRVVVVIEKQRAKTDEWQRRLANAAFESHVSEQSFSDISVQTVCLAVQIRDEDVEQSVAVDIAHIRAHTGKRLSIIADGDAGQ